MHVFPSSPYVFLAISSKANLRLVLYKYSLRTWGKYEKLLRSIIKLFIKIEIPSNRSANLGHEAREESYHFLKRVCGSVLASIYRYKKSFRENWTVLSIKCSIKMFRSNQKFQEFLIFWKFIPAFMLIGINMAIQSLGFHSLFLVKALINDSELYFLITKHCFETRQMSSLPRFDLQLFAGRII